jgi:hypothetical protein
MTQLGSTFGGGRVAALTQQAIGYAAHLRRLDTPARIAAQAIYDFNRLPAAAPLPGYAGSVALADEVESELAAEGRRIADRYGRSIEAASKWLYWIRRDQAVGGRLRHKLYVSPTVRSLRPTLALAMRVADDQGVPSFKLGLDAHGVLRSDKLVVYFTEPEARRSFADEFLRQSDGLEAHGVPLTRPFGESGLLSSAEDPLLGDLSWRQLVSAEVVDIVGRQARTGPVSDTVERTCRELERRGLMPALVGGI